MKHIIISRFLSNENKTLSTIIVHDERFKELARFAGLELPDKNNQRNISCIPAGKYEAQAINRYSNNKYAILLFKVPNRSEILIHSANYVRDILGCIIPGKDHVDIDGDGIIDVNYSTKSMQKLEKHIPIGEKCKVTIIDTYRNIGNLNPKKSRRI